MTTGRVAALRLADEHCEQMVQHYENFTVASRLTPRRLRRDLTRVYAFCRTTDDLGDETGDPALAVARLEEWRHDVLAMFAGEQLRHPVLTALAPTVFRHALPAQPFIDLIQANVQDQTVTSYEDWPALLAYCRLSAAPVGRIVLRLFDVHREDAIALSDDVCIGLQLANFAQDVSVDAGKGRTYLLQQDIREHGEAGAVRAMCERARDLLASGRRLERMLHGRLRLQLCLYRLGGEAILDAIAASGYQTHSLRPVVSRRSRMEILFRLLRNEGVTPEGRSPSGAIPEERRSGGTLRRQDPRVPEQPKGMTGEQAALGRSPRRQDPRAAEHHLVTTGEHAATVRHG